MPPDGVGGRVSKVTRNPHVVSVCPKARNPHVVSDCQPSNPPGPEPAGTNTHYPKIRPQGVRAGTVRSIQVYARDSRDGTRRRGRISETERGELAPEFQIASAMPSLTAALSDTGTLIMLARRVLFFSLVRAGTVRSIQVYAGDSRDGTRRRGRISETERGELAPEFQIASAMPSLTAALSDTGTLIMLARRVLFFSLKRRRATKKPYSRSIVGATLEVIQKKRAEKPEVRDAAREAALRLVLILSVKTYSLELRKYLIDSNEL
ncbi:hypothetical protein F2Q70_00040814 [Brassica cretica]|uniref:Uncharacterized protein n=1 Tax=Brassica cretica TaxID=69181 RepID=A0A8S9K7Q5_BRACR|nr:hypothetical protein F2Q70_00040814 [Brassica cretica]